MAHPNSDPANRELKASIRSMWALGNYHEFATELVWTIGPELVAACAIGPGQHVLDVAAGTGNVAIRAAQTGATVVASDLTPENFEAGRRAARAVGATLEWVEADAEALPMANDEFDVVTSAFGAIFAPDHQKTADELLRVCRPGGTIGMANFTPDGTSGAFFELFARHAPAPPPGALSPVLWGTEAHLRRLFGDRVASLEITHRSYPERAESPRAYVEFFKRTFGPAIGVAASLRHDAERAAAFERDFLDFAQRENRGQADGPAEYCYGYLLAVARKRERSSSE